MILFQFSVNLYLFPTNDAFWRIYNIDKLLFSSHYFHLFAIIVKVIHSFQTFPTVCLPTCLKSCLLQTCCLLEIKSRHKCFTLTINLRTCLVPFDGTKNISAFPCASVIELFSVSSKLDLASTSNAPGSPPFASFIKTYQ